MSHRSSRAVAAIALVVSLGACATASPGFGSPADPSEDTAVEVRNQAFSDMIVYVLSGGGRWRLGIVPGNSSATLRLPHHLVPAAGALELLADPIGGRAYRMSAVGVSTGQWIELTLHESPSMSQISVWTR